jgi:cell division protein FtsB
MGFFGSKKPEEGVSVPPETFQVPAPPPPPAPTSSSRLLAAQATPSMAPRVGIDHAIMLIRSLPTEENVGLVVTVLKTTLESLQIRVADIVADAARRQQDIQARVSQLKSEMAAYEQEIMKRAQEIERLDAVFAETTKVKEYLEIEEAVLVND